MGTLVALVPLLGLLVGVVVAHHTKSELKQGQPYFVLFQHAIIASIPVMLLWKDWQVALAIGVILFAILWKMRFPHPIELMPVLSVPAVLAPVTQTALFLYFIPTGTLNRKNINTLLAISIVYAAIVITASL